MPVELRKRTQKAATPAAPVATAKKAARKPVAKKAQRTNPQVAKRTVVDEKNQDIDHHTILKQEPAAKKQKTAITHARVSAAHPTRTLTDDQDTMVRGFFDGVLAATNATLQVKRLHQRGHSLTDDQDDRVKSFFDQVDSQSSPNGNQRSAGASPTRSIKAGQIPARLTNDQDDRAAQFFDRVESPVKKAAVSPLSPAKRSPLPAHLTNDQDSRVAEFFGAAETNVSSQPIGGRPRQLATSPNRQQLKRSRSASPSKIPVSKSNKKLDNTSLTDDIDARIMEFYEHVVGESSHADMPLERLQDPLKAAKRKIIGNELRRMSHASSHLAPHEVKALAMQNDQHSQIAAAQTHESIVKQIENFGPSSVKNILAAKKRNNATPSSRPAKKARTQIVTASVDSSHAKRNSIKELHDLVSPLNRDHRPSIVKTKVTVKRAKTEVNAEIMKTATLRQIRKMGNNWKNVLHNQA